MPEAFNPLFQVALNEAKRRIEEAKDTGDKELRLNNLGLLELPESLWQLTQLDYLDLSNNQLTVVPETLRRLRQLLQLNVSGNQLRALPEAIGQLTQLRYLDVSNNELGALPNSFRQLEQLEWLVLSKNRLTALPETVGKLARLQGLYLQDNQLATLPEALRHLPALERLYLHENPDLGLPAEILGFDSLTGLGSLSLRSVDTQKPPREILDYYFRIHPTSGVKESPAGRRGGRPLLEARIIVIGDGAAGKTSLVRQLLHSQPAQKDEASTRDVVIAQWPVTLKGTTVQVNLWDFGGQRQMHAAHPYFFTTRTLYLVVAEARKDQQDRVDYWLKMVAKYGDAARALVVVNKADAHAMALDRPKLLDRYRKNLPEDSSDAFFATSCTKGTGIDEVRKAVHQELESMSQVWALWPDEWFQVKESILELRQPKKAGPGWLRSLVQIFGDRQPDGTAGAETLNFDTWRGICQECGVTGEKDRDHLLENLGHLGQVVCFPRDARLRELGVLNPEWVTRGIYPLLVETTLAAKGGMLTLEDLAKLLPSDRYPKERHPWLVDLMKAFELVFEDAEGRLLLPGQLPADSPAWAQPQEWSTEETLHLELRYDAVLPESVVSQFIVRRSKEARKPGEWWRHGIALKRGRCEALVRAHTAEQEAKIELRLRGPREERRDFLTSIRESLRDPKDTTPPELHVILGKDCAPKYNELLIHAARWRELPFIIDGQSVTRQLAPILDMIEAPAQQEVSREAVKVQVDIHNENKPIMNNESYNNTGDNKGIIGKQNQQTISQSFNTQGMDVAALLQALQTLRQESAKLPPAQAEAVRPHLAVIEAGAKTIEAESKKEKPNQTLLDLTRDGMVTAAKTCAAMAPSLMQAAKAVAEWFA